MAEMKEPAEHQPEDIEPHKCKCKCRVWLWIVLAIVVILVAAVALAPTIASSAAVREAALKRVNEGIRGHVELAEFSTSWGGPTRIVNLRITDPEGREVVNLPQMEYSGGVWRAIMNALRFHHLTIESPAVVLYMDKDNQPSLSRAFESRTAESQPASQPKKEEEKGKAKEAKPGEAVEKVADLLRDPKTVTLSEASVRVVYPDGRVVQVLHINEQVKVDENQRMESSLQAQLLDRGEPCGKLDGTGTVTTEKGSIVAKGKWGLSDLVLNLKEKKLQEKNVDLQYDAQVNPNEKRTDIHTLALNSSMVNFQMSGSVTDYDRSQTLDLKVHYAGDWDRIMSILHQLAPDTAETVALQGKPESDFTVKGPANEATVAPVFREVTAAPSLNWASAKLYGLDLGKADLRPELKGGILTLPMTKIPGTAGGSLNIGMIVDFTKPLYTLTMPGQTRVLDGLVIDREVGKHILSRVNPIFGQTTRLEGRITLVTQDLYLPLGEELKRSGRGKGHLDLSEVKVSPAGVLGDLMKLTGGGLTNNVLMKIEGLDFAIENGRVKYDNFVVLIGETIDMRFSGSVGFDDTVDMKVSLPVTPAFFKGFNVGGPVEQYSKSMKNTRVEIPIRGTRLAPQLDTSAVNPAKMLEGLAPKGLGNPLDILGKPKSEQPANPQQQPSSQPAEQKKDQNSGGMFRGLKDLVK